jgi:hypothetical protein
VRHPALGAELPSFPNGSSYQISHIGYRMGWPIINGGESMGKPRPKMTINEVIGDMRERGFKISQQRFTQCAHQGVFPFVTLIQTSEDRQSFLIFRKNYEAWADEYLGGYEQ